VERPTWRLFAGFLLAVTVASLLLNLTHPLDQWSHIYVLVYQPVRVPLYIGYFVLGIVAHQRGWFTEAGYSPSIARWLPLCLVSGLAYLGWRLSVFPTVPTIATKAIANLLFNLFCFSSLLASLALFHAHMGHETPFWRSQARNSYGVYYLHPLILYPLALVFVPFPISIYAKAAAITLLTYLASWGLSAAVLTRVPGLRWVMKIGVFDSGIGGLSVLHEARKVLPHEHYLYYADTAHVPYGTKPKEEIRGYSFEAITFLRDQGCDAIVVACNTATSVAIDDLRAAFSLPIIGMEPAVKPAVQANNHKRVLVFATEMTLKEPKFHNLVSKVDNEGIVDYLSLQELVLFSERFEFAAETVMPYLHARITGLDVTKYGHVVLGCTHFIYFRPQLRQLFSEGTILLDGNAGTVQHLKNCVAGFSSETPRTGNVRFFHSGVPAAPEGFERYLNRLDHS
jgi:glutamate racemase